MSSGLDDGITDVLVALPAVKPMADRGPRPVSAQMAQPWRLLLQIDGENRTSLGVAITPRMLVGRSGKNGSAPEINLAPFNALQNGVSRRHARLTYEDDTLYLEDLNSTNGTRINGQQLVSGHKYRLKEGDELEFGRLRLVLRLVRSSVLPR